MAGFLGLLVVTGTARVQLDNWVPPQAVPPPTPDRSVQAFRSDSWWNTPLPADAPSHHASEAILHYLSTGPESGNGCLALAGLGDSPWGTPIYFAGRGDPTYLVHRTAMRLPPELDELRIPRNARPSVPDGGTLVVYDVDKNYVVALSDAVYDAENDSWSARGATVSYLDSNGLDVRTGQADARNTGNLRGGNAAVMVVSWDEVEGGEIDHVLSMSSGPTLSSRHVFPMVGSDGAYEGKDPAVPPQGLRLRIKASVDLAAFQLDPQALVIARALQEYGVVVGSSGGSTALKLESTVVEGRGDLWNLKRDALCRLPFSPRYWDVVAESFTPGAP